MTRPCRSSSPGMQKEWCCQSPKRRRDGQDLGVLTLEQARQYLLDELQVPDATAHRAEQAALQQGMSGRGTNASIPATAAKENI